jgi:hypothetical protein
MVKRSFLPGQPLSPAIPEVRRGPSRFLQVTSDRSRGSQTPSSDAALVARGSVPQPPTTHKTAPSTWTCSNHAAPQATSAVISPLLAQDCLTRLCLITLRSTLDPILLRTAVRRGPSWTAKCHPAPVWSRRWPGLLGSVLSAELSWLLIDQVASGQAGLSDGAPAVGRRCGGRECRDACHAVRRRLCPPSGVHPFGFHVRVRSSSRPGSSRPVSGHRAPASGVRPSGVRSSGVCRPPGHIRLVRVSPAVA